MLTPTVLCVRPSFVLFVTFWRLFGITGKGFPTQPQCIPTASSSRPCEGVGRPMPS